MGLLWIGQGSGRIYWPASSFMIDERPWVARGGVLALVGLIASRSRACGANWPWGYCPPIAAISGA
jgi:hypothetical protein